MESIIKINRTKLIDPPKNLSNIVQFVSSESSINSCINSSFGIDLATGCENILSEHEHCSGYKDNVPGTTFPYSRVLFFKTTKSMKNFTHKNIALYSIHTK